MVNVETSDRGRGRGFGRGARRATDPPVQDAPDDLARWRDLITLAADLAFETDSENRFSFLFPDTILGWPKASLLGQPADSVLASVPPSQSFNPFHPITTHRFEPTWVRRADGSLACFSFTTAPLLDPRGTTIGCRGVGVEMNEQNGEAAGFEALRRGAALGVIPVDVRREVLAPQMMRAVLQSLMQAMEAHGIAVFDLANPTTLDGAPSVLYGAGFDNVAAVREARALLRTGREEPLCAEAADGSILVAVPCSTRFGERAGLALWRAKGGRVWDINDQALSASAAAIVRVVLEHVVAEREASLEAQTDPLTGLFNRRAFLDELTRRIGRLEFEQIPGTLMLVDLDHFKDLNVALGHEVGDAALLATASLLREVFRPTDLLGRLGSDTFVVWLDGADHMTAAERAEQLRLAAPERLAALCSSSTNGPPTMSIGIATRDIDSREGAREVMHRAGTALDAAKRGGRGNWRVAHRSPIE